MAGEQFCANVSITFWAETGDDAQARIDEIKASLPADVEVMSAIGYVQAGKPEPPPEV